MLPWLDTAHQRVEECRNQFESFCSKIFGKDYDWIHYQTSKHCGEAEFARTYEVNVAEYETVQIYKGEDDSILGPAFVSFLVLLLFIWLMLMLSEFRAIYNFLYVVWYTPSTSNVDPSFASMENDKLVIHYLPISHKLFALIGILLPRFIIGCVILTVGTRFLTATNNLQDLVLNSTALGFLIEVDNMIHTSLLGDGFEKHVMNRSEQIEVQSGIRGQHEPYGALLLALLCTAGYTYYAYYNPYGLKAVGQGIECLCAEAAHGSLLAKLTFGSHQVICFDGLLDSWADTLHGLLEQTGNRQLSNTNFTLDPESRLIFETDSLSQVSPSTLCRCGTVHLDEEAPLNRSLELHNASEALLLCSTFLRFLEVQLDGAPRQSTQTLPGQLATGRKMSTAAAAAMTSYSDKPPLGVQDTEFHAAGVVFTLYLFQGEV
eukprot:g6550.t1